jgi:hypothetical protein
VFFTHLLGKEYDPRQYPIAKDFFMALANNENQRRRGIIPFLVVVEILAVLGR